MLPYLASCRCLLLLVLVAVSLQAGEGGLYRRPETPAPVNSAVTALFGGTATGTVLEVDRMSRWFTLRLIQADGNNVPPAGSVLSVTCKANDRDQMLWIHDLTLRQQITISVVPGENRSLTLIRYPVPPADPKATTPRERKRIQAGQNIPPAP